MLTTTASFPVVTLTSGVSIVGVDTLGYRVAENDEGDLWRPTDCCDAPAAQTAYGICCTACFEEVDSFYGKAVHGADVIAAFDPDSFDPPIYL